MHLLVNVNVPGNEMVLLGASGIQMRLRCIDDDIVLVH